MELVSNKYFFGVLKRFLYLQYLRNRYVLYYYHCYFAIVFDLRTTTFYIFDFVK